MLVPTKPLKDGAEWMGFGHFVWIEGWHLVVVEEGFEVLPDWVKGCNPDRKIC